MNNMLSLLIDPFVLLELKIVTLLQGTEHLVFLSN